MDFEYFDSERRDSEKDELTMVSVILDSPDPNSNS